MTPSPEAMHEARFAVTRDVVRSLDPEATDAAIRRYLAEIEIMAQALASLEIPVATEPPRFDANWPGGAKA